MNSLFFIVGVGRSGTSLLQSILSSHTQICIPPETGYLRNGVLRRPKHNDINLEDAVRTNPRLRRIIPFLPGEADSTGSFRSELELYRFLIENYKKNQNKRLAGDKDPRLVEFIDAVAELFPDSKFIHLLRDPRDVLLSKKKAEWSRDKPVWYHIFANYVQLKLGEQSGEKLPPESYLLVRYESILDSPEETLSKICDFLDVDFQKSMLSFQEKAKELVSDDEKQWKKETMGPLLKNNTRKWRGKLDSLEVALTEIMCSQALDIGGYETSNSINDLAFFKRLQVNAMAYVLSLFGKLYSTYRLSSQKK